MRKIIYILAFVSLSAMTVTSCTEEEVKPQSKVDAPGGSGSTDKI